MRSLNGRKTSAEPNSASSDFSPNPTHRGSAAVAQRVKDQIEQAHSHVPVAAQQCLNQVLDWLDRDQWGGPGIRRMVWLLFDRGSPPRPDWVAPSTA